MPGNSLLDAVRRDLLAGKPVSDILRTCILLGTASGSTELRTWATKELKGYDSIFEVPAYRKPSALIQIDAIVGRTIIQGKSVSPSELPQFAQDGGIGNEVAITNSISEIQAMYETALTQNNSVKLAIPGSEAIMAAMDRGVAFQSTQAMYWSLGASALAGVVDNVKTTLAELLAELGVVMPDTQEEPTGEEVTKALSVAVSGGTAHVSVTAPTTSVHASGHAHLHGVTAGAAGRDLVQSGDYTPESADAVRTWLQEYTNALPEFDAGLQPLLTHHIAQVNAELDKPEPQEVVVTTLLGSLKTFAENAAAAAGAGAGTMGLTQLLAHWPF